MGRGILAPLAIFMTLLYILIACLAGYMFNRFADGQSILGKEALALLCYVSVRSPQSPRRCWKKHIDAFVLELLVSDLYRNWKYD